jgi:hypothetical protein
VIDLTVLLLPTAISIVQNSCEASAWHVGISVWWLMFRQTQLVIDDSFHRYACES